MVPSVDDREFIRNVKFNNCKIDVFDPLKKKETAEALLTADKDKPQHYTLPDGSTVQLAASALTAAEILFNPSLIGKRVPGIHELVYESVGMHEYEGRRDLFHNVVLSGGNFNSPGVTQK